MPRKAKDEVKETKTTTKRAVTRTVAKKTTTKTAAKKTTAKKSTTKTAEKKTATKKATTKAAAKKTTTRKATTAKKVFLTEYYDLPIQYNKTVVKLLAQTPEKLFVYWEISDEDKNNFIDKYGSDFFETTTPILKVYNKTLNYSFEIEINDFANCWYINVDDSSSDYQIELDRKFKTIPGKIVYISTSNDILSPNDHILFEQNLALVPPISRFGTPPLLCFTSA